jgi:uncharacterized membrane protein YfcA
MDYIIIAVAVCIAAALTFFSGFGLGTIMLPIFSLFFDLPVAIGATAIVHLANNVFKFSLVYKHIHRPTLLKFGIPALLFAVLGGWVLGNLDSFSSLTSYAIGSSVFEITPLKLTIGILMIFFAWFDLSPKFSEINIDTKYLPVGGALSGFFGGVSGHQGAFRAAFLSKAGLDKKQFIGTSNAIALIIDVARLFVYAQTINFVALQSESSLLVVGILFAFVGTYFGKQLVEKTTMKRVQQVVGVLLFAMGTLFIMGII